MKLIVRFAILILIMQFLSCGSSNKIQTLTPETDFAAPLVYSKEKSYLEIPIAIKLNAIEQQTNAILTGLIYEDDNIFDDNMMVKVWKQAPIKITDENGKIKTVLPLKVWARIRYGGTVLGYNMYDTREFNFNGVVTLLGDVSFKNWQLLSKTKVQSVDWIESPSITIGGRSIAITYLINPAMNFFKSSIEAKIDEAIEKSLNFQSNVIEALQKISKPMQIDTTYNTWFQLSPTSLNVTEAKLKNNVVYSHLELGCFIETFIGKPADLVINKNRIQLNSVENATDEFTANLMLVSPFLDASEVIAKNFAGQEFSSGSKKVTINSVNLWHKAGKIIVALSMKGSVNGTIYLSGIPEYNALTNEIYFDKLDYVFDTKSSLMRTANWLLKGMFLNKIKSYTTYSIKNQLNEAKLQLATYLNNYSPAQGILLNGSINDIEITNIQLTNLAVVATLKTTGKVQVKIDELNY